VLTVNSYVLDTDDLAVVLDDGRKYSAEVLGTDPVHELAVLKLPIEDEKLPCFALDDAALAEPGDRILAVSNLFNIAAGDEPVSALQGVVSGIGPLEARRGSFETSFRGSVYFVDAAANNPGAAGGALVDWQGRLLGLLGKELRSRSTGAWLNYALPVEEFSIAVENLMEGRAVESSDPPPAAIEPLSLADLGITLVPDVLPRTPPYIDAIAPASAAGREGLQVDDLVVFVAGEPTASCAAVVTAIRRHEKFDEVRLSVLRNGRIVEVTLGAEDAASEDDAETPEDDAPSSDEAESDSADE
jgi:serine protease Do